MNLAKVTLMSRDYSDSLDVYVVCPDPEGAISHAREYIKRETARFEATYFVWRLEVLGGEDEGLSPLVVFEPDCGEVCVYG